MSENYILAIDQGTSGTKAVIINSLGRILVHSFVTLKSYYPDVGHVEQNPSEIYRSVLQSVKLSFEDFKKNVTSDIQKIAACGISNQRETVLLWDKSGNPLCNAIVWQCKRSVNICSRLKNEALEKQIASRTGLIIDPYFSGTKVIWLYENDKNVRKAIDKGDVYLGTVDSWLLFKLTGNKNYFTDYSNASRTMLFNTVNMEWDGYLLEKFNLTNINLPEPKPSTYSFGETNFEGLLGSNLKITAMAGDSHAAAFGECSFSPGAAKATMGTGLSLLMNTGSKKVLSQNKMISTICWSIRNRVDYALEGIVVTCGATIQWLRDQLNLFLNAEDTEKMAYEARSNNGVYFVPAFSGLGSPYWKMELKANISGLTFGCNKNHIVRSALESIAYQIKDNISVMEKDSGLTIKELVVDGGLAGNNFLLQFLADLLDTSVVNIGIKDVSALGAAYLAGLECGIFDGLDQLSKIRKIKKRFVPGKNKDKTKDDYSGWLQVLNKLFL
jgi:glycerol kinase